NRFCHSMIVGMAATCPETKSPQIPNKIPSTPTTVTQVGFFMCPSLSQASKPLRLRADTHERILVVERRVGFLLLERRSHRRHALPFQQRLADDLDQRDIRLEQIDVRQGPL